jgi:[ribosomal protein S18]-alanine N-acetyltransferase
MCAERAKYGASLQLREFVAEDAVVAEEMLRESPEAAHWSVQAIQECLQLPGVSGLIIERDGCAAGFILGRRVVDEGEILNLAVRPEHRRRGDGSVLVKASLRSFREGGVTRVFLDVRESNVGGIAFYEKMGFRRTGVRQSYYREPAEAAVLMEASTKEFTV